MFNAVRYSRKYKESAKSLSEVLDYTYSRQSLYGTDWAERWAPSPPHFVVNHYYLNIDTEIGEMFLICWEYTPAEAYSGALCCLV